MQSQPKKTDLTFNKYPLKVIKENRIGNALSSFSKEDVVTAFEKINVFKSFFQQERQLSLGDLLNTFAPPLLKKASLFLNNISTSLCLQRALLFLR